MLYRVRYVKQYVYACCGCVCSCRFLASILTLAIVSNTTNEVTKARWSDTSSRCWTKICSAGSVDEDATPASCNHRRSSICVSTQAPTHYIVDFTTSWSYFFNASLLFSAQEDRTAAPADTRITTDDVLTCAAIRNWCNTNSSQYRDTSRQ